MASNLAAIKAELQNYSQIFTTNYDLLLYWAIMSGDGPVAFKDYFLAGGVFDGSLPEGNRKPIYYLHGALHLYKDSVNRARKRLHGELNNLLALFVESFQNGNTPLFVSEGTSEDKLQSITESDYLSFALTRLQAYRPPGPLVIFGHSLSAEFDDHIVKASRPHLKRRVAISVFGQTQEEIAVLQLDFRTRFPEWDIWFFDPRSHPLGAPKRRAAEA